MILATAAAMVGLAAQPKAQSAAERAAFQAELGTIAEEHARHARALTLAYVCRAREIAWFNRAMDFVALQSLENAERLARGNQARADYALAYFTGAIAATRRAAVAEQRRFPVICDGAAEAPYVTIYDGLVRR